MDKYRGHLWQFGFSTSGSSFGNLHLIGMKIPVPAEYLFNASHVHILD